MGTGTLPPAVCSRNAQKLLLARVLFCAKVARMTFQAAHTGNAAKASSEVCVSVLWEQGAFGAIAVMTQHLAQGCTEACAIMTQHLAQGSSCAPANNHFYYRYC